MRRTVNGFLSPTLLIYLGIAAALVAFGGYGTYRWLEADKIRTEQERDNAIAAAHVYEEVANDIKKDANASDAIAKKRADQLQAAHQQNDALVARLEQLTDAKAWFDTSIPDSVRKLRREYAGCASDLSMPCTEGKPTTNPNSPDAGRVKPATPRGVDKPPLRFIHM